MTPNVEPNSARAILDLVPFGLIDPVIPAIVAANIQAIVGVNTHIRSAQPRPEHAYMPSRKQYDASRIIKMLADDLKGAPLKLGLIRHDLCVPILTYVYGESQLGGKAAVVSIHRLFDTDSDRFYTRAAKIAIHELGHLLGLGHCWEVDCLMRFSKQLDQLDALPMQFCSACSYDIGRHFKP